MSFTAGILTVSDSSHAGRRPDASGPVIREFLLDNGFRIDAEKTVPDEVQSISGIICEWVEKGIDLILTTGGTGLTPRDVTPEATRKVIEREIPGIIEAMIFAGLAETPMAMLSRGVAGTTQGSLIINLPGSPAAVSTGMRTILPVLGHALRKIKGDPSPCHKADQS